MEWATFTMDNNVLFIKDGSTLTNRTFVAVKGSGSDYNVALYDGKHFLMRMSILVLILSQVPVQLPRPSLLSRSTS
jgi:hypothetical protein